MWILAASTVDRKIRIQKLKRYLIRQERKVATMKTWKYLLSEFIMVFVAVTLGLLAENWRQERAEKKQEKEYIKSLISDLKADLPRYEVLKTSMTQTLQHTDTLVDVLHSDKPNIKSAAFHKQLMHGLYRNSPIGLRPSDVTVKLLQADGFKVISNRAIIDSVMTYYDESVYRLNFHYDNIYMVERIQIWRLIEETFDQRIIAEYWDPFTGQYHEPKSHPKVSLDPKNIFRLRNKLVSQQRSILRILHHIERCKGKAQSYIKYLEGEL
jgi:hypothetical protein